MTVLKQQYAQYLNELGPLFTEKVFDNIQSFKKILSPDVTDVMEIFYNDDTVLIHCEWDERAAVYETITVEEFVDWLDSLDDEEPDGDNVA